MALPLHPFDGSAVARGPASTYTPARRATITKKPPTMPGPIFISSVGAKKNNFGT
jgi:hypothetical protein